MEKKLPGVLQGFANIPKALKDFPKNLSSVPVNAKELEQYKQVHSGYMCISVLLLILGFVLYGCFMLSSQTLSGVGMLLAVAALVLIIFLAYRMNNIKNTVGVQIGDLSCPGCQEMITYDENVEFEVLDVSWHVHSTKLPTKRGEEARTSPQNITATGKQTTSVKITCKCQHCGREHRFTQEFTTGVCEKRLRDVSFLEADRIKLQVENEVRAVSQAVFVDGKDGRNDFGVTVSRYSVEASVKGHFDV